jgi:hypothetical protein
MVPHLPDRRRGHILVLRRLRGQLYGNRAGREEIVNLRAGTLDDTKWLAPVAHLFMKSARPWVLPAANAACHEAGPDDFRPLAEAWRAMWPDFHPQK